jgi:hypothetical protein
MPGHSRSKNSVASLAIAVRRTASLRSPTVPGIHVFAALVGTKAVDGRDKPGHDECRSIRGVAI